MHLLPADVEREHEHAARAILSRELLEHLRGAEPRHAQIEHRDVRRFGPDALERLGSVAHVPSELEVARALDRSGEPVDVDGMVVGDEYPDRARVWSRCAGFGTTQRYWAPGL